VVSGSVPAAPDERELLAVPVPAGTYTGISLGDDVAQVDIHVTAGQVEPVLIGIEGGRLIAGAAYAGNDQLNLGLGELAGKFVAMPAFGLVDQDGKPFDNAAAAGQDLVIAAFHTTCHETCPLYTALFFQLQRSLPGGVRLSEVSFKTMESRVCPGLYLGGELLDIDGLTGGFNFQSAWTTGWLAGRAMSP